METRVERLEGPEHFGKDIVEFRIIFTGHDFAEATHLTTKYNDHIGSPLSEDTPLADMIQDLQMLMFRLEQEKARQKNEKLAEISSKKN